MFTKTHAHGPPADYWSLGVMLYEMIFGIRPFEKHCPITYVKYLNQIYSKYPICESFRSLTEASVRLSTQSSQGDHRSNLDDGERRQSCPHVSTKLTPELSFENLKDTSSSDDSTSFNSKVVRSSVLSSRYCHGSGKIDDPTWKNEIRIGDVKLEIKLRIPARNIRSEKISRECRWFFLQLFDPLPWARKDWKDFDSLAALPWFQKHKLSASDIVQKKVQPPCTPPCADKEFVRTLSIARGEGASANFDSFYEKKRVRSKVEQRQNFSWLPNIARSTMEYNDEEEKYCNNIYHNYSNNHEYHFPSATSGKSTDFKSFNYINKMYGLEHYQRHQ